MKLCKDCEECQKINRQYVCHELFDRPIDEIEIADCPLEISDLEIEKIKKAESQKIQHGAKDENKKRKAPPKKIDDDKIFLIKEIAKVIDRVLDVDIENYEITNISIKNPSKMIEFDFNGQHFTLDLVRKREKK